MAIELLPIPPIRDLSKPQDVSRLRDHLLAIQTQLGRLSDNADAPDTPTAIAVRQGAGKVVEVSATFAEPPFPWTAELWRNTTNSVATATKISAETSHTFHDTNVAYASTYYYWVRTVGLNGVNFSGWSPSSGHSITVSQVVTSDIANLNITTGLLADLGVTTGKINDFGVTTSKRQLMNQQSFSYTVAAGSFYNQALSQNTGAKVGVTSESGHNLVAVWIYYTTTASIAVVLYNLDTLSHSGTCTISYW